MLNGNYPLLLFTWYPFRKTFSEENNASLISPRSPASVLILDELTITGDLPSNIDESSLGIPIPIPIYLGEEFGIVWDSDSNSMASSYDSIGPKNYLRRVDESISVNISIIRNSGVASYLYALFKMAYAYTDSDAYTVSYFCGETFVVGGKLTSVNSSKSTNNEKIDINIEISYPAPKEEEQEEIETEDKVININENIDEVI